MNHRRPFISPIFIIFDFSKELSEIRFKCKWKSGKVSRKIAADWVFDFALGAQKDNDFRRCGSPPKILPLTATEIFMEFSGLSLRKNFLLWILQVQVPGLDFIWEIYWVVNVDG